MRGFQLEELKLEEERRYQEWWAYVYASCNVVDRLRRDESLLDETQNILPWLKQVDYKYDLISTYERDDESMYLGCLVKLANCLVYSHHKNVNKDSCKDLVYEQMVLELGNPFAKLNNDEKVIVEQLHQVSLKFGFLIVALLISPPVETNWRAFVESKDDDLQFIKNWSCFPYRSIGNSPEGFQISIPPSRTPIKDPWDVAIFFDIENDELEQVEQKVNAILWRFKNKRNNKKIKKAIIGNDSKYSFAVYFRREEVNITRVMNLMNSQIRSLRSYSDETGVILLPPLRAIVFEKWLVKFKTIRGLPPFYDKGMLKAKDFNELRWVEPLSPFRHEDVPKLKAELEDFNKRVEQRNKSLDSIYKDEIAAKKFSEGLSGRKRPLNKDNFRRAVAIKIWQSLALDDSDRKTGKAQAVKKTIDLFLDQQPEAIEYYRPNYFHYILKEGVNADDSEVKRDPVEGYPPDDFKDERYCDVLGEQELLEREFYADLELTENCIEQCDYLRVGSIRKAKRVNN